MTGLLISQEKERAGRRDILGIRYASGTPILFGLHSSRTIGRRFGYRLSTKFSLERYIDGPRCSPLRIRPRACGEGTERIKESSVPPNLQVEIKSAMHEQAGATDERGQLESAPPALVPVAETLYKTLPNQTTQPKPTIPVSIRT